MGRLLGILALGSAVAGGAGCRALIKGDMVICVPQPGAYERRVHGPFTTQVGREVTFLFSVPDPEVNYAVIHYGDQFVDVVSKPLAGRFRFKHRFLAPTPPEGMEITARAYVQQGTAWDWVPDATGWTMEQSPNDKFDLPSGKAKIVVVVYDAVAEFHLPADKKYDFATGTLKLYTGHGKAKLVTRAGPNRDGFRVSGPVNGQWIVYYRPNPEELRPDGPTRAELGITNRTDDLWQTFETQVGPHQGKSP